MPWVEKTVKVRVYEPEHRPGDAVLVDGVKAVVTGIDDPPPLDASPRYWLRMVESYSDVGGQVTMVGQRMTAFCQTVDESTRKGKK